MKIAFWDPLTINVGLQKRLLDDGNEVHVFFKKEVTDTDSPIEKTEEDETEGFRVIEYSSPEEVQRAYTENKYDLVFATERSDDIIELPCRTIGVSKEISKIELDRNFGISIVRNFPGIKIPKTTSSLDEALHFETNLDLIVVKTHNNELISEFNMNKTFIIEKSDLSRISKFFDGKVIYQEYIQGYEIAFGGYFSGDRFIRPLTFMQECKRRYPKVINNTYLVGESGTCGHYVDKFEIDIFNDILDAHVPYLIETGYKGFFDINTRITSNGDIYFLEYTPRMGDPTEYETLSLLDQSYSSFLQGILIGRDYRVKSKCFASAKITDLYHGLVPYSIFVPPAPKNISIVGLNATKINDNTWQAKWSEDQILVTGMGDNVKSSSHRLYDFIRDIKGMGIYFLDNDIGTDWVWD